MDTNNQLINQVTGDYTATDYQNISLGITDLEARPMPMPQTGHVIDYSQYQLDPHQAANYTGNQNINMVMMPFANTPQVMPQFFTRIPIQSEEEQPMYVNAKQYHRIMKRRIAREKMNSMNPNHRKRSGYLHQSRHNHACKRPRGEGGRFLSKNSIKQQQQQVQQQVSNGQALAAVVLSNLPPLQPQPTQMQQSQQQSSQMQQQQQQQSPSQQQVQQSQQLSTQQQIQQQIQAHKLRSSKHSQSSSLSSSSSSIPSPSREISPQIVSNQSDQQNMNMTSADDITSSQSVQGFQQFQSSLQQLQSPLQQLQQQFQIHTSAPDNDSKSEPTVSSGSMADNTLPPLDKDMLDNWNY